MNLIALLFLCAPNAPWWRSQFSARHEPNYPPTTRVPSWFRACELESASGIRRRSGRRPTSQKSVSLLRLDGRYRTRTCDPLRVKQAYDTRIFRHNSRVGQRLWNDCRAVAFSRVSNFSPWFSRVYQGFTAAAEKLPGAAAVVVPVFSRPNFPATGKMARAVALSARWSSEDPRYG
jgi:hypothetical protein